MGSSRGSVMLLGEGLLGLTVPLCPRGAMSNAIKGFGFTRHQLVFRGDGQRPDPRNGIRARVMAVQVVGAPCCWGRDCWG